MKLSLILLALYIGLLSCFPCQDSPACTTDIVSSNADSLPDDAHEDEQAGDLCSPFCTCSCCATVNIPPMIFGYALAAPFLTGYEKSFGYKALFTQNNTGLIWQPPRLV